MCQKKKWYFVGLLCATIVFMFTGGVGQTQSQDKYPTRAIDIIVPLSPGGSTDLLARLVATYASKKWGVPVNVINKPGGNQIPACLEVHRAVPDGYTTLCDGGTSSTMLLATEKNLPYKTMDRTFIAKMIVAPNVVIVASTSSIKSMKDLAAEAKKDPGNFTWTSMGGTSFKDLGIIQFLKTIGVDVSKTKPIMVKGGNEPLVLTAGGHVKVGIGTTSQVGPSIEAGLVKALAIICEERWPFFPDLPTTVELGYPEWTLAPWNGISGPPNLPFHIVDKWDKAIQEMLKDPEFISKLKNIGAMPSYLNTRATKEFVMKETEEVKRILR